ncbi:MAG TPA: thiamine phosphate synthase [Chitinophagales bacterium]|nr:thiamine phosphate synthase [Chitinophagales bacterium]
MKIIVVSPEKELLEEHGLVQEMFRLGLQVYHVRKPKYSTEKLRSYLEKFDKRFRDRLVIHTHHELAIPYKVKGVHLTERHRKKLKFKSWITMQWVRYRRPDIQVSTSFHVIQSILKNYNPKYRYVFLNPIFDSISKIGYKSTFNEHSLRDALQKTKYKVIAMGGVTHDNIDKVADMGFAGFSLAGTLWLHDNPVGEFKRITEKCKELDITFS